MQRARQRRPAEPGLPPSRGQDGHIEPVLQRGVPGHAEPVQQAAVGRAAAEEDVLAGVEDRKSTRLNSSHSQISYAVFCLKKKKKKKVYFTYQKTKKQNKQ